MVAYKVKDHLLSSTTNLNTGPNRFTEASGVWILRCKYEYFQYQELLCFISSKEHFSNEISKILFRGVVGEGIWISKQHLATSSIGCVRYVYYPSFRGYRGKTAQYYRKLYYLLQVSNPSWVLFAMLVSQLECYITKLVRNLPGHEFLRSYGYLKWAITEKEVTQG